MKRLLPPLVAAALILAPAAGAHITVNPSSVPADSFARFAIRVPNERGDASTTQLSVRLPDGLVFVSFEPKPGWTRTVTMRKLAEPVTVEGERVTEQVGTVTWQGGKIGPGEFDEFGLSARVPAEAGGTLSFPAVQTYSDGEVARWIGPQSSDEPAAQVRLEAAEPTAAVTAPDESGSDSTRANLALGFGIAGLVVGLAALAVALFRKQTRA